MKAVVFDFDGTLTEENFKLWKKIWKELGYEIGENSYYESLVKSFMSGKITHKQWCELTLKAFQERGFTEQKLDEITKGIVLIDGVEDLFKYLKTKGVELHIVSGNIVSVIKKVLRQNVGYITAIKANEFLFDKQGKLVEIVGTKYDYEGKATYIKELCKKMGCKPQEILFVGNSINDEWVCKSGVKTICVNPDEANIRDSYVWNKVIYTNNLMDLKEELK